MANGPKIQKTIWGSDAIIMCPPQVPRGVRPTRKRDTHALICSKMKDVGVRPLSKSRPFSSLQSHFHFPAPLARRVAALGSGSALAFAFGLGLVPAPRRLPVSFTFGMGIDLARDSRVMQPCTLSISLSFGVPLMRLQRIF